MAAGSAEPDASPLDSADARELQRLDRAIALSEGFVLFPVEVQSSAVAHALGRWLVEHGHPVITIEPGTAGAWADLAPALLGRDVAPGGVVLVVGADQVPRAGDVPGLHAGLRLLNQRRDSLARHLNAPLVWCGTKRFLDLTWREAPDFWSVADVPRRLGRAAEVPAALPARTERSALADVLVVTAVAEEHAAVLEAGGGAKAWDAREGVAVRDFEVADGTLRVAVTQALGMGGAQATIAAAELVKDLGVRCLAMCGVCAGRRGEVELGDVIVADRVWQYGAGKRKATTVKGKRVVEEQEDVEMYRLHPPEWKLAAERFVVDRGAAWLKLRPRSLEAQGDWILERVLRGADPSKDPGRAKKCADWKKALGRLWKKGLLEDGTLTLTAAGKKHIERVLLLNGNRLPKARPFEVHVGPIASGSQVMADDEVFARLSTSVRKVLGVEMEAAAIGALGWARGLEYSVVMKGVMDHADAEKNDNFKEFAARASAEVLLAFLRRHVPPWGAGEDNILARGTSELPKLAGPAALLNARHEVVPFYGREDLLDETRAWCEGEGEVRARLIHAAGGMGKTRLAIELCRQMRAKGWRAGFLQEGKGIEDLLQSERPALIAVDYAESRTGLREALRQIVGPHRNKKLRVLLLARNADEWWTDLLRSDGNVTDLLREEEPRPLASMTTDRGTIFREAAQGFAKHLHKKVPDGAAPGLEDPRYARILYVHAAALATVEGRDVKIDALMEDTLDHEERFWREQLRERGHAAERKALNKMRLAVAALTLKGGASSEAEVDALTGDEAMTVLLHDLYPGRAPQYVGGLEPDLLGEAMVWRALSEMGADAEPYLDRLFKGADGEAIRTGFTVLGRLSEDHKEATAWIARMLAADVKGRAMEAFEAAKTVGERTAHAALGMELAKALEREGTVELAKRLEKDLPRTEKTVSLREVGLWVQGKLLEHLPEGARPEVRASLLGNLSVWQSALGRCEAALASAYEVVAIFETLAKSRPEAFQADFATSLNNLGNMQSDLGQYEAALASMQKAVDIERKLVELCHESFLPGLAHSLNNLGNIQGELGRREEALRSTEEAVNSYRKLVKSRPEAFLPDLAMSLINLGASQGELGQHESALASTQEAVDIYRELAQARPEAILPDLAASVDNLGVWQSKLGQCEAALISGREAVDIRRKLAGSRPEAFSPDLANSLNNLGDVQSQLAQHESGLASLQEALDAIWPFFLRMPAAFGALTGVILVNLRQRFEDLGRDPPADVLLRIDAFLAMRAAPPAKPAR